jgi:hypothetical protein
VFKLPEANSMLANDTCFIKILLDAAVDGADMSIN